MEINKIVTGGGDGSNEDGSFTQELDACNSQVKALFENKPNLTGVILTFEEGGSKQYVRL